MNAILILYGANMSDHVFEPLLNGKNSFQMAIEQASKFPGVGKTVLLASLNDDFSNLAGIEIEKRESWTRKSLLEKIAQLQEGFDLAYFVFADCPFLDPALAQAITQRHTRYAAEYSYADGWPYGLAPEILSPGTAAILSNITGDKDESSSSQSITRDILFSVIQKDINAFDIEAEISSVDLRCHRLNFCADSKRNLLLLKNFITASGGKIPDYKDVERITEEKPEILRTLPSFYPVQVYGGCPQKCVICPYPSFVDVTSCKDFMAVQKFESLMDKIVSFSGNAVIDLSLWGELSLHPDKLKLIEAVLSRKDLSLIIETSGLGWKAEELDYCAMLAENALSGDRNNNAAAAAPLSWIVSLDTRDPKRYNELRSSGFAEAEGCAKKLLSLFPDDCYVQAVRVKGAEDDTEKFYRYWKETSPAADKNIIIQKYDDFCGFLEKKQASDISPVIRQCCWHIMRDFPVLLDGAVPLCREDITVLKGDGKNILGNVFSDSLENIWHNGEKYYIEQCKKNYPGICADCDEYYTYNF